MKSLHRGRLSTHLMVFVRPHSWVCRGSWPCGEVPGETQLKSWAWSLEHDVWDLLHVSSLVVIPYEGNRRGQLKTPFTAQSNCPSWNLFCLADCDCEHTVCLISAPWNRESLCRETEGMASSYQSSPTVQLPRSTGRLRSSSRSHPEAKSTLPQLTNSLFLENHKQGWGWALQEGFLSSSGVASIHRACCTHVPPHPHSSPIVSTVIPISETRELRLQEVKQLVQRSRACWRERAFDPST